MILTYLRHHGDMASRMISPVFAGRGDELAALAGEFAARVRGRALVLAGGCVELSTASSLFLPERPACMCPTS
jgi:hypothetical protein